MIPNSEIWGSPETWESGNALVYSINNAIGGKMAVFDDTKQTNDNARYSVNSGITAGKLTIGQPFDTSCCPWRIKGDSYFLGGLKKFWIDNNDNVSDSELYIDKVNQIGAPILLSSVAAVSQTNKPKMTEINRIWEPAAALPGVTPNFNFQPLLSFYYNKIILVGRIIATNSPDSDPSNAIIYGVDRYYEVGIENNPYVRGIGFILYYNDNGTWIEDTNHNFNINPVNAYIKGFNAITIDRFEQDFSVLSDGINGNPPGSNSLNTDIQYRDSDRATTAGQSYYNQYENHQSILYVSSPDNWEIMAFSRYGINYVIPYIERPTKEYILSQLATLGFWFYTGLVGNIQSIDLSNPSNEIFIPLFDENGTTTGEYLSGAEALTAPAAAWTNDVFERNIYHGEPEYDPTNYDPENKTVFPDSGAWTISEGFYGIPYLQLQDAIEYLYTWAKSQQEVEAIKEFLVTDPIDVVHSLTLFPINIVPNSLIPPYDRYKAIFPDASIVYIQFGNVLSDVQAFKVPYRSGVIDLGYIDVFEKYESFLDYSPYTSIMIYLPFCGFQALDCDKYMGHRINIKYVVDIATGACTALLLRDNLVCDSVNGQMGVTIPLTGLRASQIQAAIDSSMLQYKQKTRETAIGLASLTAGAAGAALGGNPLALGGSILGAVNLASKYASAGENLEYNLSHIHTPFATIGTATSAAAGNMELTPRLYISRPKLLSSYDPEIYGHTIGYSCLLNVELSQVSGFTRCSSADLSGIQATAQEKQQLLRLLQSGVYI